jgi:hypothetical protein
MALPGVLGLGLAMQRAGRFTGFLRPQERQYGVEFVVRRLFNVGLTLTATVKDGQIDWDSKKMRRRSENDVLGEDRRPGMPSVHGGMRVLLERGARYSRIVGPGVTLGAFSECAPSSTPGRSIARRRVCHTRRHRGQMQDDDHVQADEAEGWRTDAPP